eukprot:CAMPEP_0202803012 /NCGR_PEP_ID=MMETSP1388-20130828/102925_1 /ASSEMBLY_ACC=CAM_ASM_000864 /TAXON_ID=37098 /ORGANISM="Isochrysis sp, Strain CCMP1244" /LENGTH=166 /DNA_ID=CAMNT_0049473003 /DNA_START=1068 /DNA_END=1569 /DNA_ORIENTATION=-
MTRERGIALHSAGPGAATNNLDGDGVLRNRRQPAAFTAQCETSVATWQSSAIEQTLGLEGLEDSKWPSHLALSMHSRKSPNQSPNRFSFCLGPALRSLDRVAATTCLSALPLWCTVARLARMATALLSTTTVSSMNLGWSGAISMSPATVGRAHPVATVNSRPRQL